MASILIVEDNPGIRNNLVEYLELKGHQTDNTDDGLRALGLISINQYDLVILDIMIPGIDGLAVCKKIRKTDSQTAIIFLSAKDTVEDRISGLSLGADDYLIKPFSLTELDLRVQAVLRRTRNSEAQLLTHEDLVMDLSAMRVTRAGQETRLNPITFKILKILLQHKPAVVDRETLESEIWCHTPPNSDSLRTNMHFLRNAVDKPFEKKLIQTRTGFGWSIGD